MLQAPYSLKEREQYTLGTKPRLRVASRWVTKLQTYLQLPAFSIDVTWRGASEIVKKFNFDLDKNISLIHFLAEAPSNPNYVACVSWKPTTETIVRYKLWQDVGEILYVPLYSGQTIKKNFAIEIWNIKPAAGQSESGTLASEEDAIFVTEDSSAEFVTESGEGEVFIGIEETIGADGALVLSTSRLILPTNGCDTDRVDISNTVRECTDLIFDYTDYNPFDGDYYNVILDCGLTELIHGTTLTTTELVLQSSDDTWHRVFLAEFMGNIHIFVEQDNTSPSLTPYVVMREITTRLNYKLRLHKVGDNHHYRMPDDVDDTSDEDAYNTIYFTIGALDYGLRMLTIGTNVHLSISQDGI